MPSLSSSTERVWALIIPSQSPGYFFFSKVVIPLTTFLTITLMKTRTVAIF